MNNMLKVARKEFTDLLNNRLIIIALAVYLVVMVLNLYKYHMYTSNPYYTGYSLSRFISFVTMFLTDYGSLISVILGFLVISSEKRHNTISTLIIKPLYRDTIINGKLIGAAGFLLCVLLISSLVYMAGLLVIFGGQIGPVLGEAIVRLPSLLLFSLIYTMVFFSVSMLMSILVKDEIFALFISLFFWFVVIKIVPNVIFNGNLSLLLAGDFSMEQQQISEYICLLSPEAIRSKILLNTDDIFNIYTVYPFEIGKLLLYNFIAIIASYICFIRSDIS